MSFPDTDYFKAQNLSRIAGVALLLVAIALGSAQGAEIGPQAKFAGLSVGLPQTPLTLVSLSPVIANGQAVGAIAVYDDPTTQRPADYIEVLNREGVVVIVSWFDSFGIERLVVDRALLDGGQEIEGVFVAVVNGDVI
jgi:hypothetical protein